MMRPDLGVHRTARGNFRRQYRDVVHHVSARRTDRYEGEVGVGERLRREKLEARFARLDALVARDEEAAGRVVKLGAVCRCDREASLRERVLARNVRADRLRGKDTRLGCDDASDLDTRNADGELPHD
jgi:hypothetical protein